ncbi:MAG: tRNA (adenosine(37)-N6)-threonylcarbamoyltransferase complex dimerization subunit type 1 TsaB [Pedobacter sp.]|nr:MAG: tRNA (adenosine(37)-N6)-threonylcarbamoyltransferase complex dimerization subunit type 1 TsaB [Pedobacter sp.]
MSIILLLETATSVCSVALSINGKTVAIKEEDANNIHASKLTLFIKEVLTTSNVDFADLDAIAVSMGPGSYTGLRIGVSTAKGLCFALDKPLIAINTLKAMASGYISENPSFDGLVCPMIDARRMEVFTAIYDQNLNEVEETYAKIIDEHSFSELLSNHQTVFIGNGAEKSIAIIKHHNAASFLGNVNSASNLSILAQEAFTRQQFEDVAYFEPFYLKDFVVTTPKRGMENKR